MRDPVPWVGQEGSKPRLSEVWQVQESRQKSRSSMVKWGVGEVGVSRYGWLEEVEGEGGKGGGREWGLGGLIGDEEEGGEVSLEGE